MRINEKEYKLNLTGYSFILYKETFGNDLFSELDNLKTNGFEFTSILKLVWVMAKTYNKDIEDFEDFANSITNITDIVSAMKEITEIVGKSTKQTNELKKK